MKIIFMEISELVGNVQYATLVKKYAQIST